MKKFAFTIALILLAATVLISGPAALSAAAPTAATISAPAAQRTLTASGTGEISVKPDQTIIVVGVSIEKKDAKTAQAEAATAMNNLIAAMKKAGVKEADMKTSQYTIYPSYDWSSNKQVLTGYNVSHMLTIRVDGTDKAGAMIDAATAAGANQVQSVTFGLKDQTAVYNQALQKAVAAAKGKADVLAKAVGSTVDAVITIIEGGATYTPVQYAMADMARTSAAGATELLSGEMTVSATVSVTYSLK